jgi:hypothetical protein
MENLKKVMVRVAPSDWELFKEIAKMEGSNESVEVRRFIKNYLAKRTDKINELLKKGETK